MGARTAAYDAWRGSCSASPMMSRSLAPRPCRSTTSGAAESSVPAVTTTGAGSSLTDSPCHAYHRAVSTTAGLVPSAWSVCARTATRYCQRPLVVGVIAKAARDVEDNAFEATVCQATPFQRCSRTIERGWAGDTDVVSVDVPRGRMVAAESVAATFGRTGSTRMLLAL